MGIEFRDQGFMGIKILKVFLWAACLHCLALNEGGCIGTSQIKPATPLLLRSCKQTTVGNAGLDLLLRWTGTSQHTNTKARVTCTSFDRCEHVMILQRWLAS